jgi:hypothetical protein
MHLHGFGVVSIVGIDPKEAKVGNLVVKIHHKGLMDKRKYGSKFVMELENGSTFHNSNASFSSLFAFPNIDVSRFEKKSEIPKVGDIWIPKAYVSFDCFIKIFIPRIEKLFKVRNRILKVDIGGSTFILKTWRLCLKLDQGLKWQLESADE